MWGHSAKVASSFPSSSDIRGVKPWFLRPHLLLVPSSSSSRYSSSSPSSLHVARPIALPKNVDLRQQVSDFSLQVAVLARWNCKHEYSVLNSEYSLLGEIFIFLQYQFFYKHHLPRTKIYDQFFWFQETELLMTVQSGHHLRTRFCWHIRIHLIHTSHILPGTRLILDH